MASLHMVSKQKDNFARKILGDKEMFFNCIYRVQEAGRIAVDRPAVRQNSNTVCILPMNVEGLTRRLTPLALKVAPKSSVTSVVHFDPRSITVVGGSAVQIYDELLHTSGYRKQTTDIDVVWWPKILLPSNIRDQLVHAELVNTSDPKYSYLYDSYNDPESPVVDETKKEPHVFSTFFGKHEARTYIHNKSKESLIHAENHIVTSASLAIQSLIQEYAKALKSQLSIMIQENIGVLKEYVSDVYGYTDINIDIDVDTKYKNLFIAGICNVWAYMIVKNASNSEYIKLVEVSIHDGGSSQRSNTIESAPSDIIFSRYQVSDGLTVPTTLQYGKIQAQVPTVERLLDQQLMALKNRIYIEGRKNMDKIDSHILRCKYLYNLLETEKGYEYTEKYRVEFSRLCTNSEYAYLCEPTPVIQQQSIEAIAAAPIAAAPIAAAPIAAAPITAAPIAAAPIAAAPIAAAAQYSGSTADGRYQTYFRGVTDNGQYYVYDYFDLSTGQMYPYQQFIPVYQPADKFRHNTRKFKQFSRKVKRVRRLTRSQNRRR